ncbi:MAG: DUF427 domain-containing protein [Pseudomonadota bacterium]
MADTYTGSTATHPIEDVRHYPRPPKLEKLDYPIEVTLNGTKLVSTTSAYRVLETFHAPTYYVPPTDVAMSHLSNNKKRSICEWKGPAHYFDIDVGGEKREAAAWHYPEPFAAFAAIAGFLAFYCHPMDQCLVDGIVAEPQPGNFYGGWVTPWITGPIKGAAGTSHW